MTRIFQFVPYFRVADFEADGWVFSCNLGAPHGFYSCLMEWCGDGEPIEPSAA